MTLTLLCPIHSTQLQAEPKKIKLKIALSPRGFVTNHWPQNNWNRVHWKMYTHCYFLSEWLFLWFINGFGVWHASVIHDFLIFFLRFIKRKTLCEGFVLTFQQFRFYRFLVCRMMSEQGMSDYKQKNRIHTHFNSAGIDCDQSKNSLFGKPILLLLLLRVLSILCIFPNQKSGVISTPWKIVWLVWVLATC